MSKSKTLKVTLIKSLIGRKQAHKDGIKGLGLRKIRQTVELSDTPEIRGIINHVRYLITVEE